jgi:hypothetical protein
MAILCMPLVSLVPKDFKKFWLSNLSIMSVPDYVNPETRLEHLFMNSEKDSHKSAMSHISQGRIL